MADNPKRSLKVFLCHAHGDKDKVRELYFRLKRDGVDAWLDKESLLPGSDWEFEIRQAVRDSDIVVVCLSNQFKQKGFRQREVQIALEEASLQPEGEIFIIPARLEECETLQSLRRWHWVDLFEDNGYEMLMRALRVRADKIGAILQSKRSWLPNITTPHATPKKGVEIKRLENARGKPAKVSREFLTLEDDTSQPSDKLSVGWDSERMPSLESEKAKSETSEKLKREAIEKVAREKAGQQSVQKDAIKKLPPNLVLFLKFIGVIGIIATLFWIGSLAMPQFTSPITTASATATEFSLVNVTLTPSPVIPTKTKKPSITPTKTQILTLTPLPTEITDDKGAQMALVPEGEFTMGSDDGAPEEKPAHTLNLAAFYIDKYEVSNAFYRTCVEATVCLPPTETTSITHAEYYGNPEFNNHPVIYVDWHMAKTYCKWRGARLPTEAEWEKAARGTSNYEYPWGSNKVAVDYANYWSKQQGQGELNSAFLKNHYYDVPQDGVGDTTSVNRYSIGARPYGISNMSGNVREWVSSLYLPYPYLSDDGREDAVKTGNRVLRGGSWADNLYSVRVFVRENLDPSHSNNFVGFRCARDVNP